MASVNARGGTRRYLQRVRCAIGRWIADRGAQSGLKNKSISGREILKIQIAVRSDALHSLKNYSKSMQARFSAATETDGDIKAAKAKTLRAEIVLKALKHTASE
jgi:hypothetical protein